MQQYSSESRVKTDLVQCEKTEGGFQNKSMPLVLYSNVASKAFDAGAIPSLVSVGVEGESWREAFEVAAREAWLWEWVK